MEAFPIAPAKGHAVVEPISRPSKTRGGIHLPDDARKGYSLQPATVKAVGGKWARPGDVVLIHPAAGYEVTLGGEALRVVPRREILGVVAQSAWGEIGG